MELASEGFAVAALGQPGVGGVQGCGGLLAEVGGAMVAVLRVQVLLGLPEGLEVVRAQGRAGAGWGTACPPTCGPCST
ncbi:hypothetical protein ACFW1A_14370 [Kitasatospora sp. NPDC058965]|uniref:hypothetical protein n=1 Tax=Kitasatospora sp. NPDC058965 TaxID=3346682 RepID=UPI0036ABDD97